MGTADQGAVHIHAGEGAQVIGVVRLPELNPPPHDDEQGAEARGLEAADAVKRLTKGAGADGLEP